LNDIRRQFRSASLLLLIIMPVGVIGYMAIEDLEFGDAIWLTVITLTTIGYGDIDISSNLGRFFTIALVLVGLGAITFFLSSSFALLFSAEANTRRHKIRIIKKIDKLRNHYIICGTGEMVDKTIGYLLQSAHFRREQHQEQVYKPIDDFLDRLFGDDADGNFVTIRNIFHQIIIILVNIFKPETTILDLIIIVTKDTIFAEHLRRAGLLVVEGDPADDDSLEAAGIKRAQAIMVMLNQDTEGLLTVLTARNMNPTLYITAATIEEELKLKMIRAGANVVLAPYEVAGQFLNNATLRPTVNDYFNSILFDHETNHQITQLELREDSPWIGKRISELHLRERFDAGIIGIRLDDSSFIYAPSDDRILNEEETLLGVAPGIQIPRLQVECHPHGDDTIRMSSFQRLFQPRELRTNEQTYSLIESEEVVDTMSNHFVICGTDRIVKSAVSFLDPARPFVIISNDNGLTREWLKRGFRVIHGDPTKEETQEKARVKHAQAIMISIEDKAAAVLTVLTARSMSKRLLISVSANTDDMIEKLQRSGADRVLSPFHVAAQFVLLSTTRTEIAEFLHYVLYNEQTGLETAELYMEDDSPWIGETIESLRLTRLFRAGVIGIRKPDHETFIYAPPLNHVIQSQEVLIVVTQMIFFDEMRDSATGQTNKRPKTLRRDLKVMQSAQWSHDMIQKLIKERGES
jgi:voltage-gated potassium channel